MTKDLDFGEYGHQKRGLLTSTSILKDPSMMAFRQEPITVTVGVALKITGLGKTKLYDLIAKNKIETIRVGARRLVNFASLKTFLEKGDAK